MKREMREYYSHIRHKLQDAPNEKKTNECKWLTHVSSTPTPNQQENERRDDVRRCYRSRFAAIAWLSDWCLVEWLVSWLSSWLPGWFAEGAVGSLAGWLVE